MKTVNLSGKWQVNLKGEQREILLPGSTCENSIGNKKEFFDAYSKEAVRTAVEKYEYVGEIAFSKEIEIEEEDAGKCIKLFMERVNVSSKLFIDGIQVRREIISLSTPHIYDLTGLVTAGRHLIKLVVNNSDLVSMSNMSSGYSVDTQGYWNGVIGKIELQIEDICHIETLEVYPKENKDLEVKLTLHGDIVIPEQKKAVKLFFKLKNSKGEVLFEKNSDAFIFASKNYWYETLKLSEHEDKIKLWDEFDQPLYTLSVRLEAGDMINDKSVRFGFRTVKAEGKHIFINGRRVSFRGNVDCAQFPKTGYPPMTREVWEHNLGTMKEWGLNLVRFHGWCPPEVAFEVADEIGMYLQVEMPLWLNKDVTPLELGDDPIHRSFFTQEAVNILKTYGNHPSFIFFSNGNENMGDYSLLEDITRIAKAMDNRHLYAITSNFDHPVGPVEDYFLAMHANELPVRIQHLHDEVAKSSSINFDDAAKSLSIPFMNFEVGQYGVYPDVDIIDDYDGNMLPVNFDVIKKELIKAGVYDKRQMYKAASGDLCARLYKEDVEAVYRTKDMSGYQLLCLQDYSGQYTATVGVLDVMYRDKGIVKKEKWREYVGPVVPLFMAKRIFNNKEKLVAKLDLYDYGKEPIENPLYEISITKRDIEGEAEFYSAKTTETNLEIDLSSLKNACELTVELIVSGHKNHWTVFVYPESLENKLIDIVEMKLEIPVSSGYIPVFWSPVMFETDKPSGAMICSKHELFRDFPTKEYPDYQWKTLLDGAVAADLAGFEFDTNPIVELVPNYVFNRAASVLFEGIYENKKALYCGLDLSIQDLPTQHLKNCIYEYVSRNEITLVQMTK